MLPEREEAVDNTIYGTLSNTFHVSNGSDSEAIKDIVLNAVFVFDGQWRERHLEGWRPCMDQERPERKKHQYIDTNGQLQPQFDDGEDCGNDNMVGIHGIHFLVGAMLTRSLIS